MTTHPAPAVSAERLRQACELLYGISPDPAFRAEDVDELNLTANCAYLLAGYAVHAMTATETKPSDLGPAAVLPLLYSSLSGIHGDTEDAGERVRVIVEYAAVYLGLGAGLLYSLREAIEGGPMEGALWASCAAANITDMVQAGIAGETSDGNLLVGMCGKTLARVDDQLTSALASVQSLATAYPDTEEAQ